MRRQLVERAQRAGVRIEPEIEVEYLTAALDLAARGLGDTIAARGVLVTRGCSRRLHSVSLDPPLYDTFAFVTRRNAHLSPATRAFMELAEQRIAADWAAARSRPHGRVGSAFHVARPRHRRRGGVPPDHLLAPGGRACP